MRINRCLIRLAQCVLPLCLVMAMAHPAAARSMNDAIAYLRLTDGFWQVWLTDSAGENHQQLTFDESDKSRVSWGPTRRQLLCNTNDGSIYLIDVATRQQTPVPIESSGVYDAQWSPDGKQIAFTATTSLQADNAEIWVADADGKNVRKLTDHVTVALTPTWNPQTGAVLYSAGKPGHNQEIWSIHPAKGGSEQLTISKSSSLDPNVSATGVLLYSSDASGNFDIWLREGKQPAIRVVDSPAFEAQPSWSPDGRRLVFYRLDGQLRRLWIYDREKKMEYPITPASSQSRYPAWM